MKIIRALAVFVVFSLPLVSFADPGLYSYRGNLSDANGVPVSNSVSITFSLYTESSGGTALWTESQTVEVVDGVFNVLLGSSQTIGPDVRQNSKLYLGIAVGADAEMTPRQLITSSIYDQSAVPVGTIMAWAKSMPNVPGLPGEWVECNGQALTDIESVLNGQIIPNLNGESRFLRGAGSSGSMGGSEQHLHQYIKLDGNSGNPGLSFDENGNPRSGIETRRGDGDSRALGTRNSLYTDKRSHLPPYFGVVWIMKVK